MRVSKLKIDKSFVHEALVDPGSAGIVRAMIGMAHALNVVTVGEGVETEKQRAFLDACRCDAGQGYLFARPLAAAEFERFLREHAARALEAHAPQGA